MREVVFDLESDGLLDVVSKVHVVSAMMPDGEIVSTPDYDQIREILSQKDTLYIGHNLIRYDLVVLRRLGIVDVPWTSVADTLALAWTLFPTRPKYGLADFGVEYGVPKPKVDDWEGLTYEEYRHRATEDVKINKILWDKIKGRLNELYS